MNQKVVDAYTDGACLGNPGPGGWGVLLRYGENEKELSGGHGQTTNNRMELIATIKALEEIKTGSKVNIYTDSKYVMNGITDWINRWKKNGWKTAANKPVANVDLWMQLDTAIRKHEVSWNWIRGHTGHPDNERADSLAKSAASEKYQE